MSKKKYLHKKWFSITAGKTDTIKRVGNELIALYQRDNESLRQQNADLLQRVAELEKIGHDILDEQKRLGETGISLWSGSFIVRLGRLRIALSANGENDSESERK